MHGTSRRTVVKSSEGCVAAGAGRGTDVGSGAAAVHVVGKFLCGGGGGVFDRFFHLYLSSVNVVTRAVENGDFYLWENGFSDEMGYECGNLYCRCSHVLRILN